MGKKRQHNDGVRKVCRCPKRKQPKCHHPWHFNYRWRGEDHRLSLDRHLGRRIETRTDAKAEAEKLRSAIRAGEFSAGVAVLTQLTLGQLLDHYFTRDVKKRRPKTAEADAGPIALIKKTAIASPTSTSRPLGEWAVSDVTTDTIERFREVRLEAGGGAVAVNRNLALLRAAFNWAVRVGYVERTPFKRGTEAVVKLTKELPRSRRLEGDEETQLLAACRPHLRAVVEAAIETGMRLGELLSLEWSQVRMSLSPEIFIPAQKAKQKKDRRIPMSSRLKAIIEMRRVEPDGEAHPPSAFVFGNEIGERVGSVTRAWHTAVLKSHGHTPEWTPTTKQLTATSCAAYAAVGLHFHDLRREAGSRWLEGGVPLHKIRDWLGHSNIAQTSTYLAGTSGGDDDYMRKFEQRTGRMMPPSIHPQTGDHLSG